MGFEITPMRTFGILFVLLFALVSSPVLAAEDNDSSQINLEPGEGLKDIDDFEADEKPGSIDSNKGIKKKTDVKHDSYDYSKDTPQNAKIYPSLWCANVKDEDSRTTCWTSFQSGLYYYKFGVEHRERVLRWQHMSSIIILLVVLLLVFMGLYFAWVQFHAGNNPENNTKSGDNSPTEIEISTEGLKVSSPVLGVIILMMSLAFFYLYLVFVYPLIEVL